MASTALLLSSTIFPLPTSSSSCYFFSPRILVSPTACHVSSHRLLFSSSPVCLSPSAPQSLSLSSPLRSSPVAARRLKGVVCCEVAVEFGGSRSSEGEEKKTIEVGMRIRVKVPIKVYHVPKNPEFDIGGLEGVVKDVVTTFKGKPISATLPYKVQLVIDGDEKRKVFVHLKEDEIEVLE